MDGLARVAGILETEIQIGQRTYRLSTPTLRAWAALEAQIVRENNTVLEAAARVAHIVPPDQRAVFWEQAHKQAAQRSVVMLNDFNALPLVDQIAALLFLVLYRHHHVDVPTLDAARQLLADVDEPLLTFQQRLDYIISGGLKNSPGPTAQTPSGTTD